MNPHPHQDRQRPVSGTLRGRRVHARMGPMIERLHLALVFAVLVVPGLAAGCGMPTLTAKDVDKLVLTTTAKNKCRLDRDVFLEATMKNGDKRRTGSASESKGINLSKGVRFEASVGKVNIGGKEAERVWWTPPLAQSQLLDKETVTITAIMTEEAGKKAEVSFPVEFGRSCEVTLAMGGAGGAGGAFGYSGGQYCQGSTNGSAGANGGDGGSGGSGKVQVTTIVSPKHGELVLLKGTNHVGTEELIVRPDARVTIDGNGGNGGDGGQGGDGCNAGANCESIRNAAPQVGDGADGGSGGNGGNGADLVIEIDPQHPDLKKMLAVSVTGGNGGAAGAAGQGGAIQVQYCKAHGRNGGAGRPGNPGRNGTVRIEGAGVDATVATTPAAVTTPERPGAKPAEGGRAGKPAAAAPGKEAWRAAGLAGDFTIKVENRTSKDICSISIESGKLGNIVSGSPLAKGATRELVRTGSPKPAPAGTRANQFAVSVVATSCDGALTGSGTMVVKVADNTWLLHEGATPKNTTASPLRLK